MDPLEKDTEHQALDFLARRQTNRALQNQLKLQRIAGSVTPMMGSCFHESFAPSVTVRRRARSPDVHGVFGSSTRDLNQNEDVFGASIGDIDVWGMSSHHANGEKVEVSTYSNNKELATKECNATGPKGKRFSSPSRRRRSRSRDTSVDIVSKSSDKRDKIPLRKSKDRRKKTGMKKVRETSIEPDLTTDDDLRPYTRLVEESEVPDNGRINEIMKNLKKDRADSRSRETSRQSRRRASRSPSKRSCSESNHPKTRLEPQKKGISIMTTNHLKAIATEAGFSERPNQTLLQASKGNPIVHDEVRSRILSRSRSQLRRSCSPRKGRARSSSPRKLTQENPERTSSPSRRGCRGTSQQHRSASNSFLQSRMLSPGRYANRTRQRSTSPTKSNPRQSSLPIRSCSKSPSTRCGKRPSLTVISPTAKKDTLDGSISERSPQTVIEQFKKESVSAARVSYLDHRALKQRRESATKMAQERRKNIMGKIENVLKAEKPERCSSWDPPDTDDALDTDSGTRTRRSNSLGSQASFTPASKTPTRESTPSSHGFARPNSNRRISSTVVQGGLEGSSSTRSSGRPPRRAASLAPPGAGQNASIRTLDHHLKMVRALGGKAQEEPSEHRSVTSLPFSATRTFKSMKVTF